MNAVINMPETNSINSFFPFFFSFQLKGLGDSYHIVPGTNDKFLLHFSLTFCFLIFFLQGMKHSVPLLQLIFQCLNLRSSTLVLFRI